MVSVFTPGVHRPRVLLSRGKDTKACTARTSDTADRWFRSSGRAAREEEKRGGKREAASRQRMAKTRCTLSER